MDCICKHCAFYDACQRAFFPPDKKECADCKSMKKDTKAVKKMAEQRLIDATDLIARGNASFGGVSDAVLLKKFVDAQPTIDPESRPIVRQLREELARVKAERDGLLKEIHGTCKTCMRYEDCKKNHEYYCFGTNYEWRGPQKEE